MLSSNNAVIGQVLIATAEKSCVPNMPVTANDEPLYFTNDSEKYFLDEQAGIDAKRSRRDWNSTAGAISDEKDKAKEPEIICVDDSDDEEDDPESSDYITRLSSWIDWIFFHHHHQIKTARVMLLIGNPFHKKVMSQ